MTLEKGDVVLVEFPFTDLSQTKLRPALILWASTATNEVTLCFISSQKVDTLSAEEFAILESDVEFASTGLRVASKVKVTRIVTLERSLVLRRLGKLGGRQMLMLNRVMLQAFQLL